MRKLIWSISRFIVKIFYLRNAKIHIKGKVPKGAAILVANHAHAWDPPLIIIATDRIAHFFASYLLFKNIIPGSFLKIMQQVPVGSGLKKLNEKAFIKASSYLRNNELVGIFPYPYDLVKKKKLLYTGAIMLIIENDVPVIPIKVVVNEKRKSRSFYDVNFDKASVIIGKPINNFRQKCKKCVSKEDYFNLTKELMRHIYNLKC